MRDPGPLVRLAEYVMDALAGIFIVLFGLLTLAACFALGRNPAPGYSERPPGYEYDDLHR